MTTPLTTESSAGPPANDSSELLARLIRLLPQARPLRFLPVADRTEIAQDAIATAIVRYGHLEEPILVAMAFRIAVNSAWDIYRKKRPTVTLDATVTTTLETTESDPRTAAEIQEFRTHLKRALVESLSKREQQVIAAKFYGESTLKDIASDLGVAQSTAHAILVSGLAKLQRSLSGFRDLLL